MPVRIVVIADIIMSLDNVIAVAAAANGQMSLLVLGLAICIPMIIAGAALIMMILDRYPVLVWLGAMLLGWIAGDVIASDPIDQSLFQTMLDGHITIDATSGHSRGVAFQSRRRPDGFCGIGARLGGGSDRGNGLAAAKARGTACRKSRRRIQPNRPDLSQFATNSHPDGPVDLRYRVTDGVSRSRRSD